MQKKKKTHTQENDEKTMKQQQQQINVLQMKIRAANQSKVNPKAIADLDKKLKEKAHVVESLRYEGIPRGVCDNCREKSKSGNEACKTESGGFVFRGHDTCDICV